jgi:hypothetical protein
MHIPIDKIEIPPEKITDYLLVLKEKNDKSAFLAQLGYTIENWSLLIDDIKSIVADNEAILQQNTPFGDMYEVKGKLKGFGIITIWLLAIDTEKYKFITLFPD